MFIYSAVIWCVFYSATVCIVPQIVHKATVKYSL